jgi:hypothetical protein
MANAQFGKWHGDGFGDQHKAKYQQGHMVGGRKRITFSAEYLAQLTAYQDKSMVHPLKLSVF